MQVSQHDLVENLMISPEEIRPLSVDMVVRDVVMRFLNSDGIPVVNERGSCVGVVYAADCKEVSSNLMEFLGTSTQRFLYLRNLLMQMEARLGDVMRGPPPSVTASTSVAKAITMLLQPNTKLLMVISDRTGYSLNRDEIQGERVLGFLTREATFIASQALPFSLDDTTDEDEAA